MKVWLVWTGEYSDAQVRGVYSSLELAQAAAKMYVDERGWIDDEEGYEVDVKAQAVRDGVSLWQVNITIDDGTVKNCTALGPATGTTATVSHYAAYTSQSYSYPEHLIVRADARSPEHAIKIAADERAKFIALRITPEKEAAFLDFERKNLT